MHQKPFGGRGERREEGNWKRGRIKREDGKEKEKDGELGMNHEKQGMWEWGKGGKGKREGERGGGKEGEGRFLPRLK